MTFPVRISFVTYNIWNTERWDFREPALCRFLELYDPDVLCLQELRRTSQHALDGLLKNHARVRDRFAGWTNESNIYWRAELFSEIEHGAEAVGHKERNRRLFWVRLRLKALDRSMVVATTHLTHQRDVDESTTGQSPRIDQTRRIIAALKSINALREPLFFMGDLNDPIHPSVMLHEAGYASCFAALGLQCPPTFKAYPTARVAPGKPVVNEAIDWIVANRHARPIAAAVPQFYLNDAAPSDHWPVQAVSEVA